MNNPKLVRNIVLISFALIIFLILSNSTFLTIEPGHKGVLFERFGKGLDKENVYGQGFTLIAPWNKMYVYDVRIKEISETMDVLSSNGLSITVDVSLRYKPIDDKIGYIHDAIGENYLQSIIIPELRSATREMLGKYTPEELYSSKREAIQTEIFERTEAGLTKRNLVCDAVLMRSVQLPATIKTAIEGKLKQEQESQEYEFRIQKEEKEAQRKRIEAKGIKDFQEIVSEGISEKLLKWKGIEATKELAASTNSKVIVIGSGDDGLPIILGGDK
jgi:regulator of protease activity HflC (stomatin/prohibitin superfamily)